MSSPFHGRAELGLRPARSVSRNVARRHATGHYWGPSPWAGRGFDHARCASIWRGAQAYHMDGRGWADIAYNSGVCPHGHRYEGRGPGVRSAANGTNPGNSAGPAICYIAGVGDVLTDEAKAAFLEEALRLGAPLDKAHSDWKSTACPGPVRDWIHSGTPLATALPPITVPTAADIAKWNKARQARAREIHGPVYDLVDVWPGTRSLRVVVVQQALNLVSGAGLVEDGDYGPRTVLAVANFQRFMRLHVDGIVGVPTRRKLEQSVHAIALGQA